MCLKKVEVFASCPPLVCFMATPSEPAVRSVRGAGKKATQAKKQLYANPLPVGTHARKPNAFESSQGRTWWDWFNEGTKWFAERTHSPPMYRGWYDETTQSVWMSDEGDAFKLWTQGFFGKGNLSRSEPTWAARMRAEAEARERGEITAEQMTQKRREERKLLKIERARAAVKAGIQLPDGVTALGGEWDDESGSLWRGDEDMPTVQPGVARIKGLKYFSDEVKRPAMTEPSYDYAIKTLDGIEHFQLTMIEAFFLAGMLGCLEVCDKDGTVLSVDALYKICLSTQLPPSASSLPYCVWARPDNPFLLHYIVYHHFRSLGWIVKSGTKFCVDFLLYKRGPVFSHAEFAVLVVPEYQDETDRNSSPFTLHHNEGEKDWVWFSMLNRVNTQVQKVCIGDSPRLSFWPMSRFPD